MAVTTETEPMLPGVLVDTCGRSRSLFEVAVLRTIPPDVTRVAALKTAPVFQLPLVLFDVLIFVRFLLLDSVAQ